MANCCEEFNTNCNKIVDIAYLKEFLQGTPIVVTTSVQDDYCPTYDELTNGSIVPVTNANTITDFHEGIDGIYVDPSGYTDAPSSNDECCNSSSGQKNVKAQDLSLYYYNLTDFDASLNVNRNDLCGAEAEVIGGYNINRHKKYLSVDCLGVSDNTTKAFDICNSHVSISPSCSETYGANVCDASQASAGDDVDCSTADITHDFSATLSYKGETYGFNDSFTQQGMSINITWDSSAASEEIESEGTSGLEEIGTISHSDNVTIINAESDAEEGVEVFIESDGRIMLDVSEYSDSDQRQFSVSVRYTACEDYVATSSQFTQQGVQLPPSPISGDCYEYDGGGMGSCTSQYYVCKYLSGASSHMNDWTYIDKMKLKVADDGYYNAQILYSGYSKDTNQERMNAYINKHSVAAANDDEWNAVFHVFSSISRTNVSMFESNSDLMEITLPCEVSTISQRTFEGCTNLTDIYYDYVTSIGENAFFNCSSLSGVDLSNVETIGDSAFEDCTGLTSVTLSTNLGSIANGVFLGCSSLEDIGLSRINTIGENAFSGCTSLISVDLSNVETIGVSAFEDCTSLTSVDLSSADTIDNYAFYDCTSLTSVTLSTNLGSIANGVFYGCSSLEDIDLRDVETIGESAFRDCTSLTSVTIGSGVTDIGESAFDNCSNLEEIWIYAEEPPAKGSYAFYGADNSTLYVPRGTKDSYEQDWPEFINRIVEMS